MVLAAARMSNDSLTGQTSGSTPSGKACLDAKSSATSAVAYAECRTRLVSLLSRGRDTGSWGAAALPGCHGLPRPIVRRRAGVLHSQQLEAALVVLHLRLQCSDARFSRYRCPARCWEPRSAGTPQGLTSPHASCACW